MNLDQLRCFLAVARHRNFTGAAREFYLTQPAITHQISALEKELDTQLFTRTTRSVALTRAGELFLEDAKLILAQEGRALERLRQLKGSDQPELKIGYLNSPCRHFCRRFWPPIRSGIPRCGWSWCGKTPPVSRRPAAGSRSI